MFRDEEGAAEGNPDEGHDEGDDDDALFAASGRDRQGRFSVLSRVVIIRWISPKRMIQMPCT